MKFGGLKPTLLSSKDLLSFTLQLEVMLSAGVVLTAALGSVAKTEIAELALAARTVGGKIEEGHGISSALRQSGAFPPSYVAVVEAGEKSGRLMESFARLRERLERQDAMTSRLLQALAYPMVISGVSLSLLAFLLYYMFPRFAEIFQKTGLKLPLLTRLVISASSSAVFPLLGLVAIAVVGLVFAKADDDKRVGRLRRKVLMQLPLVGGLLRKISLAAVCQDLANLISVGLPFSSSLDFLARQDRLDLSLSEALKRVYRLMVQGQDFADALQTEPVFPPILVSSMSVAANTGHLSKSLYWTAKLLEEEVDSSIRSSLDMIEPLTLAGLGGSVAVIVVAAFLPIYEMVSVNL